MISSQDSSTTFAAASAGKIKIARIRIVLTLNKEPSPEVLILIVRRSSLKYEFCEEIQIIGLVSLSKFRTFSPGCQEILL